MPRTATIILRVEPDVKDRITAAARRKGQSITSFVEESTMNSVVQSEKRGPPKGLSRGLPRHLAGLCEEVQRGGAQGYARVGRQVAICASEQLLNHPAELDELVEIVMPTRPEDRAKRDSGGITSVATDLIDVNEVFEWFAEMYPELEQLIPRRRRDSFVAGVYDAFEDGEASTYWIDMGSR